MAPQDDWDRGFHAGKAQGAVDAHARERDLEQQLEKAKRANSRSRIKAQLTQAQAEITEWRGRLDAQHRLNLNFVEQNNVLIRRNQKLDDEIAALREALTLAHRLIDHSWEPGDHEAYDAARAKLVPRPLMRSNDPPERCPNCGSPEVESNTPRTTYACGSSDYDQRPGTFTAKCEAKS